MTSGKRVREIQPIPRNAQKAKPRHRLSGGASRQRHLIWVPRPCPGVQGTAGPHGNPGTARARGGERWRAPQHERRELARQHSQSSEARPAPTREAQCLWRRSNSQEGDDAEREEDAGGTRSALAWGRACGVEGAWPQGEAALGSHSLDAREGRRVRPDRPVDLPPGLGSALFST